MENTGLSYSDEQGLKATAEEEKIINERATELESIGFVFQVSKNNIWYQKGDVKMIPTLMMCASTREWNEFILEHSDKNPNHDPHPKG